MRGPLLGPSAAKGGFAEKVCPMCQAAFRKPAKISWSQWYEREHCSYRCASSVPSRERLLRHHHKVDGPLDTPCWVWTGAVDARGYGRLIVKREGKKVHWRAHRLSYQEFVGPLEGLFVCHRCDVPRCINPDHLFLGTHTDNMADRDAKGRNNAARGPQKPSTKLTLEAVEEIKQGGSASALAAKFGVSVSLIYKVRQGRAWDWLA